VVQTLPSPPFPLLVELLSSLLIYFPSVVLLAFSFAFLTFSAGIDLVFLIALLVPFFAFHELEFWLMPRFAGSP